MGGRGTASGLTGASAPAPQPAAPAPAPVPQPAPQAQTGGLTSDTGVQDMDDRTLTGLIQRALIATITRDGRQDTPAQRIADALGLSANKPESVRQEALASSRGGTYDSGTLYRTVNDVRDRYTGAVTATARQLAHDLTDSTDYGLNFGGGRAFGTGLYFAGTGSRDGRGAGARESEGYGHTNPYMMEARLKPTARIATNGDVYGTTGQSWAKAHVGALRKLGIRVDASGGIHHAGFNGSGDDMTTTVAMLMGYDGYREDSTSRPYYTIWNRGALQVARGNKYGRGSNGTL